MFTWWSILIAALALPCSAAAANNTNTTDAVALRIMPVGASVTFGVGSTTGDSYRKDLRGTLTQAGHAVNMVGSHKNGRFADNDVEATSGFVIAQITRAAEASAPKFLPNLVLLEAGTNDCNSGKTVSTAGANVSALVGRLFALSPGATVVMATLLANKVAAQDACRVDVNRQYSAVAAAMAQQQARFVLVDMRGPDAPTTADLNDTRHPNDAGYVKMAAVWSQGIQQALAKGFLSPPADNGIPLDGGDGTATTPAAAVVSGAAKTTGQAAHASVATALSRSGLAAFSGFACSVAAFFAGALAFM